TGPAQDKKEKPKAPPRIAENDPAKLKDDKDFTIQGDYRGNAGTSKADNQKVAAQVVALGDGKFDVKWYHGGMPGDGWDGNDPEEMKDERKDGRVVLPAKSWGGEWGEVGGIEDGKLWMAVIASLKKVERKSATLGAEPAKGAVVLFAKPGDEANWDKGK